jgi:hypothetical protein
MLRHLAAVVLLAAGLEGCVTYEYEHEFRLRVDGSGTVTVTARPELWAAFKKLPAGPGAAVVTPEQVKALFERSGLRVRQAKATRRAGHDYVYVVADFDDVNALPGSPAFPDLRIGLKRAGARLRLEGEWRKPPDAAGGPAGEGLLAVRFHLPSKIYSHDNAALGVERGNIVTWREDLAEGLAGKPVAFGATLDDRSILLSTVVLFGAAIAIAAVILVAAVLEVRRRGRAQQKREGEALGAPRV